MGLRSNGDFGKKHHDLILQKVAALGFKTAEYQRIPDGKPRTVILDISQPNRGIRIMSVTHGPSVHQGADSSGNHDQNNVKKTAEAALHDPSLHFEPVTEYNGGFKGREGTFKLFHVSKAQRPL